MQNSYEITNQKILSHTENYKHVIWDWNGTLVDDVDMAVEAVNVLLKENNLNTVCNGKYREIFGFPVKNYYLNLGFNYDLVSFEKLCDRFIEEYNLKRATQATLFQGVVPLLTEIKKSKKQSILSAAAQWHLDEITQHLNVHEFFDFKYGIADHYASSKLQRGRELIEVSNIDPKETIMIGDTDHDFEVASELGIACLLVADGHQTHDRLTRIHDKVIHGRRVFD